jgi:kumamolisin
MDDDPYSGMMPDLMKKFYGFDGIVKAGYTGKGQHIAIAGYDSYNPTNVAFYRAFMLDHPGAEPDEVYFNGHPGPDPDSAAENDLDAEFSGMVAPQAAVHLFFSEHNDDPGEVQLFSAILDDNRAKVANYSWGDCESKVSAEHRADMDKVFARAVAQGVTIIAASGDWGSAGCPDNDKTTADWPGAHQHVMSVGGTSIWQGDFSNKITEEVWEETGGGFSAVYKAPAWQVKVSSNAMRGFPDVSFDADPNTGESAYLSYPAIPKWLVVGGTSIGAPQWSGLVALLNEARGPRGPIGFLPPFLYGLTPQQRATSFRDIVKGKNGAYSAAVGWDPVTGFGSPLATNLLEQLVSL